jgi:hydroxymethylpyrimidine/phosphomethylpyrimidine kinase
MKVALSIAGLDPSGGAGVLADVKVFSAFGLHGMGVATAVTAQNSRGVTMASPLPAVQVIRQLEALFSDFEISAVKIGMLGSGAVVRSVARFFARSGYRGPVVLDPVLKSSSGRALLDPAGVMALKTELLPLVTLLTPNIAEAGVLEGMKVGSVSRMRGAAVRIASMGPPAVLVTGGHLKKAATDVLYESGRFVELSAPRVRGEVHGTGCHLSSAIAASLAEGEVMEEAVRTAKAFISRMMASGTFKPGSGAHYFKL